MINEALFQLPKISFQSEQFALDCLRLFRNTMLISDERVAFEMWRFLVQTRCIFEVAGFTDKYVIIFEAEEGE